MLKRTVVVVQQRRQRLAQRQHAHLSLTRHHHNHLHKELAVKHGRRGNARLLTLLQRRQARARLSDVDDGRRHLHVTPARRNHDEVDRRQSLPKVVDDDIELELADGADHVLAGLLEMKGVCGWYGLGDLHAAVVVVEDLELVKELGHVVGLLRLDGDLHNRVALYVIGTMGHDREAQRGERGTAGRVAEGSALHNGALQPENAEDVAGGHLVHSDDITTHEDEPTVETSARRYSCTGWSMSTGGWVGCLCVSGGCGDYCVVW